MDHSAPASRRTRWVILAVAVSAALVGVAYYQSLASPAARPPAFSAVSPPPPIDPARGERRRAPDGRPRLENRRLENARNGAVPDGVTVFDEEFPAVAKLDPELLDALRRAATDAADDGVSVFVTSGWRSPEYQTQLLREAVSEYGTEGEAARWVATADRSLHVSGDAVDIGPSGATVWLSDHGAGYGLCRIYRNEPWHFELRSDAVDRGCPAMYPDPTHDPRMRK